MIWSSVVGSPEHVIVIREKPPDAEGLTTRLSIL